MKEIMKVTAEDNSMSIEFEGSIDFALKAAATTIAVGIANSKKGLMFVSQQTRDGIIDMTSDVLEKGFRDWAKKTDATVDKAIADTADVVRRKCKFFEEDGGDE